MNKNFGGNHMSLNRRTLRRLSLMAGSSLAAGLSMGIATLPTTAAAQAVCAPAPSSGGGGNSVAYSGALYAAGIDCDANGDMTVAVTSNGVDIGAGGVDMDATGADDITFNSTIEIDGNGLSGALINATSASGAITINAAALDADQTAATAMTHGILATSASGAIDINLTGTLDAEASGANLGGVAGIEATTGGAGAIDVSATNVQGRLYGLWAKATGTGDINVTSGSFSTRSGIGEAGIFADARGGGDINITGAGSGFRYGIRAEAVGSGNVTITSTGSTSVSEFSGGIAAIYASTVSGVLEITAIDGVTDFGSDASAIRTVAGGTATININVGTLPDNNMNTPGVSGAGVASWVLDSSAAGGTTTTVNVNGVLMPAIGGQGFGPENSISDRKGLRGDGAGEFVVNVSGLLGGAVNFAGLTGAGDGAWINLLSGGQWRVAGNQTVFSGRNDLVSVASGATLILEHAHPNEGFGSANGIDATWIDFGGGIDDRLTNAGTILVGPTWGQGQSEDTTPRHQLEAEVTIVNLEVLENSGVMMFGEYLYGRTDRTDGNADDMLILPGATFIGSGDSQLRMDVDLNGSQAACNVAQRDAQTLSMAADCIALPGGSTQGVTRIRISEATAGDRGAYRSDGIVLVDVSGGTGAQGDFILDPGSSNYSAAFGGVIDKGVFIYPLVWDADTQQHKLVSAVSGSALQYPVLAQAVHEVWRLATGSWLERQADLRGIEDGVGGGVWIRGSGQSTERDLIQSSQAAGVAYDFDNTYRQDSYAVTIGLDVLSGSGGDAAYSVGVMGGYTNSKVDFEASPNRAQLDGWSLGAYASFISDGLFVDATVNGNKLIMDHDVPGLNLFPVGTVTSTDLSSVGGQVEAGWLLPLGPVFIEPLAGVAYVRSKFDDLRIVPDDASRPGVDVEFDDPTSLRANVGGRMGLDQDYGGWRMQYSGLVKVWNEFEGKTSAVLRNLGDDAFVSNEFSGTFTEVGVGTSVYGLDGAVSGFLDLGGMFGDDYRSTRISAGIRVNW